MGLSDIFNAKRIKTENLLLKSRIIDLEKKLKDLKYSEISEAENAVESIRKEIADDNATISRLKEEITKLSESNQKAEMQTQTAIKKLNKVRELYKSVDYSITHFFEINPEIASCRLHGLLERDLEELSPSIMLKLHCMDVRSLNKAFRENDKQISKIMECYASRYTTKANKSVYQLMVIALRAELQNILYNLKYEKLDKAIEDVKSMTSKYLVIAGEGNQSIAGTLTKFIGEIEYLFINAVKIEYNYYVKKEQAKQEQLAIREQMRQEAEERRALEMEKKKIEKEEEKYNTEIALLTEKLKAASEAEIDALNTRILKLKAQLSDVILQKDEITKLQNGKAGNIYIISNLGSFGEDVFKVGMTRRIDPQDRVNELGDASVPFKFDVHSFIFSENAVDLENRLHTILNDRRVNKVNLRKEFFRIPIDELEEIVVSIDPTAEFNKTMIAEEYRQSLSSQGNYVDTYSPDLEEEVE